MIKFELNNNRPIGLTILVYKRGLLRGGHFLIITGYKEDALQTDMFILLNDPSEIGFVNWWSPYYTYPYIVNKSNRLKIDRYYLTWYNY
jgi:hypothetical protein